ncbi:MAG: hypothetical protein Q9170_002127 [Blastenia crenularia]
MKTRALDFVPNTLVTTESESYPPKFDGLQGYKDHIRRNNLTIADAAFVRNARAMHQADESSQTYAYVFSAPPAVHGADLSYTFYDTGAIANINVTLAEIMERYIIQFAVTGSPNAPGLPIFPSAKPGSAIQNLGNGFVGPVWDEMAIEQLRERCEFWQKAPYSTQYN